MSNAVPACRTKRGDTLKGDRSPASRARFDALLAAGQSGGVGPTREQCLLSAGHTGISVDGGDTIFGSDPETGSMPVFQVIADLKDGKAFPGLVWHDTMVFAAAATNLAVKSFDVVLPEPTHDVLPSFGFFLRIAWPPTPGHAADWR